MHEASRKSTMPCLVKMRITRTGEIGLDRSDAANSQPAQFAHRSDLPPVANVLAQTVGINSHQRVEPYLPLS